MLAGSAAVDFTPEPGHVLQGHAGSPPSHTVLYPLEARSIVFADGDVKVGICSIDIIGVEPTIVQRVRNRVSEATGIPEDHLMIACSHTHCAPASIATLGMAPDPAFLQSAEDAMVQSLTDAANRLEPITLGLGCGSASFNINRRSPTPLEGIDTDMSLNYGGVVDRRARLLRVDKADGSPLAVLFHYSCHPTTRGGGSGEISPDYPGIARARIEQALGCHALYMPGCFGNIRPAIIDHETGGFGNATHEQLDACGHELGDAVATAADYVRTCDAAGLRASVATLSLKYGDTWPIEELQSIVDDVDNPRASFMLPWAKGVLELIANDAMPKVTDDSHMQHMRIGPLSIITIPGELVQEIGHAIEKSCAPMTDADDVWSTAYTNDMLGYITTQRQKSEGGYEPNAFAYFGRPARYDDEEQTIVACAQSLIAGE